MMGLKRTLGPSGMMAYLSYMAERLAEIKRVLRSHGSIYLHCDPHASHYLKVVMDDIFGADRFRNEIIWRIGWVSGFKTQKKGWIRNHDTLLYYTMSDAAYKRFNKEYLPYPEDYVRRDGKPPTGKGFPIEDTWNCSTGDVLHSIMIQSFSTEKVGYATQKPLDLLRRIIKASTNEGDVVLDPFCGCGTTVFAARELKRRFVGIDISPFAIDVVRGRLKDNEIPVSGIPTDMAGAQKMALEKPFEFEKWAVTRIPGMAPNSKQVGDGGIDGRGKTTEGNLVLAQVKGGNVIPGHLRDFLHVIEREQAGFGVFVTLNQYDSKNARAEMAKLGRVKIGANMYPRAQLWSVAEYLDNRPPMLPAMADPYTGEPMQTKDLFE